MVTERGSEPRGWFRPQGPLDHALEGRANRSLGVDLPRARAAPSRGFRGWSGDHSFHRFHAKYRKPGSWPVQLFKAPPAQEGGTPPQR